MFFYIYPYGLIFICVVTRLPHCHIELLFTNAMLLIAAVIRIDGQDLGANDHLLQLFINIYKFLLVNASYCCIDMFIHSVFKDDCSKKLASEEITSQFFKFVIPFTFIYFLLSGTLQFVFCIGIKDYKCIKYTKESFFPFIRKSVDIVC